MEGDKCGVRITPPVLEFYDAEVDTVHQLNVTVKNTSKTSKSIRYYGPKTKYFQLKVRNPNKPVAPGLCVPAVVEFEIKEEKEVTDRLVVTVDGDVIEIPLVAYPPQPLLEIEQVVNFGNLVANSKTVSHEISLVNHGSKAGDFKIKYSGDKPIAIMPSSGSVPPKSVQMIKVEYVTKQAGVFEEVVKVKLEGKETKNLVIKGTLVDRTLEVLAMNTHQPVECVRFGSTYYGSDKTECALLFNNGPEPVNFVAVLDEDAVAQEMGVDLSKSTVDALADQDRDGIEKPQGTTNVLTSLITAIPNQGTLKPYEKIPVFFRFSPRWNASKEGWKGQKKPPPRKDFALFMRIQIVGSSTGFSSKSPTKYADGSFVEVALTGTALPVLLSVLPSLKYDFGECPIGEHADVLCTIKNESSDLATTFQFRRVAHFSTHPPSGKIPANQSQDVIFSFSPKQIVRCMMYGFGDDRNPYTESVDILEDLVIDYITEMTKKAMEVGRPGRISVEDIIFLIRKDPKKYSRVKELLMMSEELRKARKAFDEIKYATATK
ncbi:cilia and flagella-associated protein 47-like [Ylistrum balloti]|uniref:cilia and flagella-associated protein 47-like n=1 Tax=Ylistrum balloti TaxID=509963 RepID=UPI002905839B|nr:cilia and flagella-associated protein 47-like [Ylistrum balloti]